MVAEARWPRPARSVPLSCSFSASPLLELAEDLWFCSCVISLPSFSLPSLPFRSRPDTSTLLAQLMFSTIRHPSFSPDTLPPLQRQQSFQFSDRWDPSSSDDEEDQGHCLNYGYGYGYGDHDDNRNAEEIFRPSPPLDDVEDFLNKEEDLNSVFTDCEQEDACYEVEYGEHLVMKEENQSEDGDGDQEPVISASTNVEEEDALSGLYDVGVLLKDQHCRGFEGDKHGLKINEELNIVLSKDRSKMTHSKLHTKSKEMSYVEGCEDVDVTCLVPYADKSSLKNVNATGNGSFTLLPKPFYRQVTRELSSTEQEKIKEHLKFWAHMVASALHPKSASQIGQLCYK
ncbi:hypothetical protein GOP47_0013606 [Adiantum capillus-veneris]|uniref:Uncharacterized protein n=1 Tax=Adiantum capillus-veneris TaxID=13818 RepID=A0A9D4UNV0_ADICA|nr:hypothetical protein GOP47_0013606 [Adiantum capillus-veneris]